jgi:hypothetical protein
MHTVCPASPILCHFRDGFYGCLGRRADALFELTAALLIAGPRPSPGYLSCEPVHRRGWGSFYAAQRRGAVDVGAQRTLLAGHPLAGPQKGRLTADLFVPRRSVDAAPCRGPTCLG